VAAGLRFRRGRDRRSAAQALRGALLPLVALALAGCGAASTAVLAPKRLALVYRRGSEVVVSSPAGSVSRLLGAGSQALLSPDGTRVIAVTATGAGATLTLYATTRHPAAHVVARLDPPEWSPDGVRLLAWSADSRYVALSADQLSSTGEQGALLVLDLRSGHLATVASGDFLGASFSPTLPDMLVYSDATVRQLDENESLLYETNPAGRQTRLLSRSGLASSPAWSADGIVFAKLADLGSQTSSPVYQLWRLGPAGTAAHRLGSFTAGPPDPPLSGPALSVSATGKRLVGAFFSPTGAPEIFAVNLAARHGLVARQVKADGVTITAAAISRGGKTLLVTAKTSTGRSEIESLAWTGGHERVLAASGEDASWNH
jgi:hypothetical protein